eukprot:CAMPEP_0185281922 /NCGR_PEP_ID=MMETSP1359-20130426/66986_1 /TAXON_ID=552665 /ORGANISM="Bigelowiella longifila, Strain CCMP242" /LENGTH=59 /DNA_ID=CAMNT_0027877405 /DNA_START=521 /DNA_END=697 /DNA_ORIENTATION=-
MHLQAFVRRLRLKTASFAANVTSAALMRPRDFVLRGFINIRSSSIGLAAAAAAAAAADS